MKEYLNTKTFEYKLAHTKPDGEWLEIPDGADKYVYFSEYDDASFYKGDFDAVWQDDGYWDHDMDDYKSYCRNFGVVLWQRPAQPEALPFIDDNPQSLNDKYAEIEQVRQDGQHFDDVNGCEVVWSQAPKEYPVTGWYIFKGVAHWISDDFPCGPAPSFGFTGNHVVERPHGF